MKDLAILLAFLAVAFLAAGCSTTPSKLERIEANEAAINALQNTPAPVVDTSCPAQCTEKIDRAFEKSQYK